MTYKPQITQIYTDLGDIINHRAQSLPRERFAFIGYKEYSYQLAAFTGRSPLILQFAF